MASKMKLSIVTPQKKFYVGDVTEINTQTGNGGIGILPEHIPFVGMLKPSETRFKLADGTEKIAFTSTGLIKVTKTEVEMLVDASEWPEEIDVRRAKEAKERAEERLAKDKETGKTDTDRAEIALQRAMARLKTKNI
ncbi:F0F1 ATP synthase subunit epsilon [Clostridium akagii]|uniref:F0F1 ATP synthase subunit epsilon n=1 Tax=Clostridium akagii TaxID=91623 RepID=UPI00047E50A5|nr:F0F1 ATP synthase subunit epsilon [Clostridium akagii]